MAFDPGHDPSILWQATLGNIHPRQQFDSGGNGGRQAGRGGVRLFLQYPVDAVTQVQAILKGLYVDIRRRHIHRPMDNLIHQANNRRLTGEIFQVLDELVITQPENWSPNSSSSEEV